MTIIYVLLLIISLSILLWLLLDGYKNMEEGFSGCLFSILFLAAFVLAILIIFK